jgi:hypothetical protein
MVSGYEFIFSECWDWWLRLFLSWPAIPTPAVASATAADDANTEQLRLRMVLHCEEDYGLQGRFELQDVEERVLGLGSGYTATTEGSEFGF